MQCVSMSIQAGLMLIRQLTQGLKRGISTSILTDVQCGGFINFEARTPIFGVWPPLTMGINVGLSNWIKFGRSLQKNFALACLGKKVTGKLGQNFLMYKCPVWEPWGIPWGIPRCKWGPHPKSRISSFKIDESPTLDVRENGSGYSPFKNVRVLKSYEPWKSTSFENLRKS